MKKIVFYIISALLVVLVGLMLTGEISVASILNSLDVAPDKEEAVDTVYTGLYNGDKNVTIQYVGKKKSVEKYAKAIVEEAFLKDDKDSSDDFDYMKNKYRGYTAAISGVALYTIHYDFKYSETKEQTQWVNTKVTDILEKLNLDDKSEYTKVKKIHDYIINNLSYDISVKCNSAYEALKIKATACQGYANLAYKMFTEAGIGCRIITGTAGKEAHAWNIVRIGDVWYNIDCTWDDPIMGGQHNHKYDYFLKSENDFKDHTRDEEYRTAAFNETYEMSEKSWK